MNITRVPCLAITVNCEQSICNGRIVAVECAEDLEGFWYIRFIGGIGPAWNGSYHEWRHDAVIHDDYLRPLPGDDEREIEHNEQEVNA